MACALAIAPLYAHASDDDSKGAYFARDHISHTGKMVDSSILDQARAYVGQRNPTGFRGHWCGAFIGMVADRAGVRKPAGFRHAKSWIYAGPRLAHAQPGAIAVMAHHVGIVLAVQPGGVVMISGNFSRRVAISFVSLRHIRAFVEPVS
jgi:uncharacterized protein (TIGR02594 family)